jgi:tRNA(adenine34) deaminase
MQVTPEQLMQAALAEARRAAAVDEVPIGAVLAGPDGGILARAHNRRHLDGDPTAHAEMLVIRQAADALGDWRLEDCTLAVTLEPCCMCAGAIVLARIPRLIYGAADPKGGAVDTLYQLCNDDRLNHRVEVTAGVLAEECSRVLTHFFAAQRAKGKK